MPARLNPSEGRHPPVAIMLKKLDVDDPDLGYDAQKIPYQPPQWKDFHILNSEVLTNARRIREEKGEQYGATRR